MNHCAARFVHFNIIVISCLVYSSVEECPRERTFSAVKGLFYSPMSRVTNRWTVMDEFYNPMLLKITQNITRGGEARVQVDAVFRRPFTTDSSYSYFDDNVHYRTYRIIYEMSQNEYSNPLQAATSDSRSYLYGQFDSKYNPLHGKMTKMQKVMTKRSEHHSGTDTYLLDEAIYHAVVVFYKENTDYEVAWLWYWSAPWFARNKIRLTKRGPQVKSNIERDVLDWDDWVSRKLNTIPFYIVPAGDTPRQDYHFFIYRNTEYSVEQVEASDNEALRGTPPHIGQAERIQVREKVDGKGIGILVDIIFLQLDRQKREYYVVDSGFSVYTLKTKGDTNLPRQMKLFAVKNHEITRHPYILEQVRYFDGWQAFSDHPNELYYTGYRSLADDLEAQKYDVVMKLRKMHLYIPHIVDTDVLHSPRYTIFSGYIFGYDRQGHNCPYYFAGSDINIGNVEVKFCQNAPTYIMARNTFDQLFAKWPYYIVPLANDVGVSLLKDGSYIVANIPDIIKMTANYTSAPVRKLRKIIEPADCQYLLNDDAVRGGGVLQKKPPVRPRGTRPQRRSVRILGSAKNFWDKLFAWVTGASATYHKKLFYLQFITISTHIFSRVILD